HSWHRLGIHIATIVGSQVTASRGCKVHFMLRPEGIASPAPTKAFTFELSPPKSPPRDVEYHYAGKSANSRDRTFTGKTKQHYGLQAKSRRRKERYEYPSPVDSGSPDRRFWYPVKLFEE